MMDYQYIKSIVSEIYTDLPGKYAFPSKCMDELSQYCLDDGFIKDGIPSVLTYFVTTASGSPVVIFSSTAQKEKAKSVGYFSQCLGWAWNKDLLPRLTDEVFTAKFYEEEELDTLYTGGDIPKRDEHIATAQIEIAPKAIRALLYGVMRRWLAGEDAVRIAVPEYMDYNSYVLAAVRRIYSYFPMALRLRAGFCSYLAAGQKARKKIFISFVPEAKADEGTIFLDASNEEACNRYISAGTRTKSIDRFIEQLVCLDDDSRESFLAGIYKDTEGAGEAGTIISVSAQNYDSIGKALAYMDNGQDVSSLLPVWVDFFSRQEQYPACLRDSLLAHISSRLSEEIIKAYALDKFEPAEQAENLMKLAAEFEPVCAALPHLAPGVRAALKQRLDRFALNKIAKLALLEKYDNELPHIIYPSDLTAVKTQIKRDEFEQSRSLPDTTPAQIEVLLEKLKPLFSEVKQYAEYEDGRKLAHEIEMRIAELEEKKNSAEALFAAIMESIKAADGYFPRLEVLAGRRNEIKILDEHQKDNLERELHRMRPSSFEEYCKAYCEFYGQQIALQNLADRDEFVCRRIIADISSFKELKVVFREGISAGELCAEISETAAVGKFISDGCHVKVEGLPRELEADTLIKLLTLRPEGSNHQNRPKQKEPVLWLVSNGVYSGRDIPAICKLLGNENDGKISETDANAVLENIASGNFKNSTKEEYWIAYEYLYRNSQAKSFLKVLTALEDNKSKWQDLKAKKALSEYIKARMPKKRKTKILMISLTSAVAVLFATSITFGFMWNRSNSRLEAGRTTVAELSQAAENRYDIALFKHPFEKYSEIFTETLNNEASYKILNEIYRSNEPTALVSVGNVKTTWAELFFWNCVYAADGNEVITEEVFTDARPKAESAILLIGGINPVAEDNDTPADLGLSPVEGPKQAEQGEPEGITEKLDEGGNQGANNVFEQAGVGEVGEPLKMLEEPAPVDETNAENTLSNSELPEEILDAADGSAEGTDREGTESVSGSWPVQQLSIHNLWDDMENVIKTVRQTYVFAQDALRGPAAETGGQS